MSIVNSATRIRLPVQPADPESETTHIEVAVHYSRGGTNWYTYKAELGGIYATAQPITMKDGCVSFILGSGAKTLLVEAARLNRKKLDAVGKEVEQQIKSRSGTAWELVLRVLSHHNLALLSETPCPVAG
jgi:hypothetical protein